MTVPTPSAVPTSDKTQPAANTNAPATTTTNSKEDNLVLMRQKYERELAAERNRRAELEMQLQQRHHQQQQQQQVGNDDDDDSEPYVDRRRLKKELARFEEKGKQATQSEIQRAVQTAIAEERKNSWLKSNPDFYEIMGHADKLYQKDPEFAETILEMPDTWERQKLVYKAIKNTGVDKPPVDTKRESEIQQRINNNARSPYYRPPEMGTAPYAGASDYSPSGQEQAYKKMQELKSRLRL